MADSPRARTLINLSAVLNMDLNFVPSVAFISDVYMADSLRARTLINLSAVLNIDLDFVPGVAFISDVYIADSLRARTLINLSAVLYEQAAARTSLSAEVGNISPRARTLINPSAVLYEQADARSGLSAEVSIIDLDFVPSVAFDAMGNVELTGDLLGDADRVNNNNNNVVLTLQFSLTALLNLRSLASKRSALSGSDLDRGPSLAKRIKTDEDRKKSTHRDDDDVQLVGDNIEELIYVSKVKHTYISFCRAGNNRNNLNIMVTNPTGREFSRVDIKSLTRFKFYKGKNIQLLRPVFKLQRYDYYNSQDSDSLTRIQAIDPSFQTNQFTHKSDKKQALYFMWDKEQDYSAEEHDYRKFYCLVITGEDTHYKQIIKKAYIMSLERASLILFII
ncbi:hypothetical protein HBI61_069810 [Parastagonospora nodorum]|nr:hypothetical protein HBI61_069810 [Parastagonospora nodorum]